MILDGDPFNGFLVDENPSVSAITINTNYINQYVVPSGKRLYVTSGTSIFVDINDPNQSMPGVVNASGKPLIFNSGESIHSNGDPFNGYLVDNDYFANCGGGGSSSSSNATIDSLSQVVSNLDSALTSLTSLFVFGCMDTAALNYNSSANINDGSCSLSPSIGDTYQGGIVFWLDGNGGGLIAAPSDQVQTGWGCYGNAISGADGTAIGTGQQNTIDIEAGCATPNTAADICANYTDGTYSDWFLPSKDELNEMYSNIGQGNVLGLGNVGGFANYIYWSSTEIDNSSAWLQI